MEQRLGGKLYMFILVCIAREFVFFLGRVHLISTGPISTLQTDVRDPVSSYRRMIILPTCCNQCSAGHRQKEKRYLAVYIY
ncbi:unnamed protein product [Staurois parvus]|uniref:Secreted protein n=1 Tax=Staurois parvus TaxID=386267 RepID=A0ABN9H6J7_9NEOB|nr:unnamed protein product [Staurois parvus]